MNSSHMQVNIIVHILLFGHKEKTPTCLMVAGVGKKRNMI